MNMFVIKSSSINKIVIIKLILICGPLFGQNLIFNQEKIELNIDNERCCLKGTYYFQNRSNMIAERMMYYPFSVNYGLTTPYSMSVTDLRDHKNIAFNAYNQGIVFPLMVQPLGEVVYEVIYCQQAPQQKMEYILTTTKAWKKPLNQAEFVIKLSPGLHLEYLSIPWDSVQISSSTTSFFISRYQFMPDSNLIVEWIRR